MAINNNSPTFTYVGWTGASVLYNNELYTVLKGHTQDRYIYWDYNTPNKFITSMKQLEKTTTRFLVAYNDKGIYTLVPNEDILVSFDESNNAIIKDKIYGLYEKSEEFEERFVAVEVDINGIRTIVGESEGDEGTLINKISKIEQQSDKIGLSVEKVTKEFNSSVEVNKLREEVNSAFLKLNTDLGVSKSLTTECFKDTKIDSAEKIKLESSISVLEKSKESLYISVNKIVDFLNEDDVESSVAKLNKGKNALNKAHENLVNIITLAISDNIITTSDRTLIINCFAQYNLKIQELKGTCDEIILLGTNGKIIEEIAKIGIKSDEIVLSVSETTNDLTNKLGQVKITADGIESTVNELREKQGVSVNLIPNTNLIDGLKGWSGLNSDIDIHNKKASNVKLPVRVHFIWLSKEGDCILIQADNGKNILIDCGEEATADSTISYLYNLGITKIDLFIATHSHSDHIGAAVKIIDNFGCKELLIREPDWNKMPEYEIGWKTKEYHEKLISKATGVGATIRRPSEGEVINVSDEISLKIFNTLTNDYTAYNYLSFSVLMSHHNNKYFFGGDMSIQSEGAVLGKLGKVDVLCVGHSGYDDTTSIDLLSEIKPDYSIILNPNVNNFSTQFNRIRTEETRYRLQYTESIIYATEQNGTIVLNSDKNGYSLSANNELLYKNKWWLRPSNDKWYWFKENGRIAKSEKIWIFDNTLQKNKLFEFDSNGICTNPY